MKVSYIFQWQIQSNSKLCHRALSSGREHPLLIRVWNTRAPTRASRGTVNHMRKWRHCSRGTCTFLLLRMTNVSAALLGHVCLWNLSYFSAEILTTFALLLKAMSLLPFHLSGACCLYRLLCLLYAVCYADKPINGCQRNYVTQTSS